MGQVFDDYLRRVRPRLLREALERVKGELTPIMHVRVLVSSAANAP
ncbi:MAG: hypothetical protein WB808_15260 [Candidatus Dormiibacterota bacterium]